MKAQEIKVEVSKIKIDLIELEKMFTEYRERCDSIMIENQSLRETIAMLTLDVPPHCHLPAWWCKAENKEGGKE